MPQANITYDAPYNRGMVKFIEELDRKHWEKAYPAYHPNPMGYRLGSFHGEPVSEVRVGGGSSPMKYNPAGNSPAYPPMNMNAGMQVNSGGARYSGVDGAVGGKFNPFDFGYALGHDVIGPALMPRKGRGRKPKVAGETSGGKKYNFGKELGSFAKPIAEKVLMKAVGLGRKKKFNLLNAVKDVGHFAGDVISKPLEIAIASKLGAGKGKALKGLESAFKFAVRNPVDRSREVAKAAIGMGKKKPNARAEIVKKVMKERGVKMIEASKIVKAEGLY